MKTVSTTTPLTIIAAAVALLFCGIVKADDKKLGLDISSAKVTVSSNQFSGKEEELIDHLKVVMKEYYIVPKDKWTHDYTHDATGDSTGTLDWTEDSSKIWQWMVRSGGLASVTDENGITTYLAQIVN